MNSHQVLQEQVRLKQSMAQKASNTISPISKSSKAEILGYRPV